MSSDGHADIIAFHTGLVLINSDVNERVPDRNLQQISQFNLKGCFGRLADRHVLGEHDRTNNGKCPDDNPFHHFRQKHTHHSLCTLDDVHSLQTVKLV